MGSGEAFVASEIPLSTPAAVLQKVSTDICGIPPEEVSTSILQEEGSDVQGTSSTAAA